MVSWPHSPCYKSLAFSLYLLYRPLAFSVHRPPLLTGPYTDCVNRGFDFLPTTFTSINLSKLLTKINCTLSRINNVEVCIALQAVISTSACRELDQAEILIFAFCFEIQPYFFRDEAILACGSSVQCLQPFTNVTTSCYAQSSLAIVPPRYTTRSAQFDDLYRTKSMTALVSVLSRVY